MITLRILPFSVAFLLILLSPPLLASNTCSLVIFDVSRNPPDPYPGAPVVLLARVSDISNDVVAVTVIVSAGRCQFRESS